MEIAVGERRDRILKQLHLRLPKGHVDPGEALEETALREVHEETGLEARILGSLGQVDYVYRDKKNRAFAKTVHFYVMEHVGGEPHPLDEEMERVFWCEIAEAERRLDFQAERDVVGRARAWLESSSPT